MLSALLIKDQKGEFQDLLDHALIDHHRTSKDHPQVDGLAVKMV
jgi:hypothetical protein